MTDKPDPILSPSETVETAIRASLDGERLTAVLFDDRVVDGLCTATGED